MESRMTPPRGKGGFMLVTVLVLTGVGLLFGAGALLLFQYQCQMRLERQHELEKVYAVRSVLNYIRTNTKEIPYAGRSFRYETGSERNLGLLAKPVESIFPVVSNLNHFVMERGDFELWPGQYDDVRDYECGAVGVTNFPGIFKNDGGKFGLAFRDLTATNSAKWWVNVGMRDTGGWLQEEYGRRYFFWPQDYVDGFAYKDTMRMCIIRNVTNMNNEVGCQHGWPLSQIGERALVFQIRPEGGNIYGNNAEMSFFEVDYSGVVATNYLCVSNVPSLCYMGLQLAGNKAALFYIDNKGKETDTDSSYETSRGYMFLGSVELSQETYRYFAEEQQIGGQVYGGIFTNDYGKVQAPELRAVFEVEATSDARGSGASTNNPTQCDFLTKFRVTPAYQYDIFLEHPATVTNRATVAQKIGEYNRLGRKYSIITYDTHGTDNKGFRQDEREHARGVGR